MVINSRVSLTVTVYIICLIVSPLLAVQVKFEPLNVRETESITSYTLLSLGNVINPDIPYPDTVTDTTDGLESVTLQLICND